LQGFVAAHFKRDPVSPPYQSVYLFDRLLDLLIFDGFLCGFEDCKKEVSGLSWFISF
jgi:hypothetical protein